MIAITIKKPLRLLIIQIFLILLSVIQPGAVLLGEVASTEIIEKNIILRYLEPDIVSIQIRPELSPDGSLVIDAVRRSITVRDLSSNVEKIEKIISNIDKPVNINNRSDTPPDKKVYLDTILLKYTSPHIMINMLEDLFTDISSGVSLSGGRSSDLTGLKLTGSVKLKSMPDNNELIIVANSEDNRRIRDVIEILEKNQQTKPVSESNGANSKKGITTDIVLLSNIKALEASQILNNLITNSGSSSRGDKKNDLSDTGITSKNNVIIPILASNSLVIRGKDQDVIELVSFIKKMDKSPSQVLIEVTILEVALKNEKSIGFDFLSDKKKSETGTNFGITNQVIGGSQGYFFNYSTDYLKAVLLALQEKTDVRVLSAPHILVTNNRKAEISIGDSIVIDKETLEIPTGDVSSPIIRTTHEYIDVGLKLEIIPTIGDDGFIAMDIYQDVNDIKESGVPGFPEISKRNLKTSIIIKDRGSVVLGGLIKRKKSSSISMVPFLGYIPVLGRLFRKSSSDVQTTELVLFVTAYVVKDQNEAELLTDKQKKKMVEINNKFFKEKSVKE